MIKKVTDRIGLVSLIAGASIICCLMGFSSGKNPEEKPRRVTTLEGLRYELERAQVRLLPVTEESVSFDGGAYLFEPDPSDVGASLLLSLLSSEEIGALCYWPITLHEDPISREMVILDAKGVEAIRLPCPLDYDPNWVLDLFYPLTMGVIDEAFFDPARVCLSMSLFRNIKVRSTVQASSDTKTTNRVSTAAISSYPDLLVEDKKVTATKEAIQSTVSQKQMPAIDPFMAPQPSAEGETQPLVTEMGLDSDSDGLTDLEEYNMRKAVAWGQNTYGQGTIPAAALNAVAIVAGYNHNLALRADGSVVAWGQNTYGQCTVPSSVSNVVSIAAGGYHSLALRSNATVIAWGYNINAQCSVPVSASNVVALTAGLYHSAALRSDGKVIAWGQNSYAQCNVPTTVTNAVALSSGYYHNLALRSNGSVLAWGQNSYGQCTVPSLASNVIAVAGGGYHSLALRADGKVIAWGNNSYQQCTVPLSVINPIAISAGQFSSYALLSDGRIIAWGQNTYAQCTGATNISFALSVAGGANHGVAIRGINPFNPDTDGDTILDGWEVSHGFDPLNKTDVSQDSDNDGLNNLTEVLRGTNPNMFDTDGDGLPDGWEILHGFDPLKAGNARQDTDADGVSDREEYLTGTDPRDADTDKDGLSDFRELRSGMVRAWGTNNLSQCNVPATLTNVFAISSGGFNNFALRGDGTFVGWPQNTLTNTATNLIAFATGGNHVLAIPTDGHLLAWGNNLYGQCTIPASASNALAFAAGLYHSLALRPDGTVVAWGNNTYGQCTVPATASNVIAIAAGDYHSLALRTDGTVIAWGQRTYLQIYPPPSATNIIAIAAGAMHNLAIRADGSVIAWGANNRTIQNGRLVGSDNLYGQCTVPSSATNVCAIAVGAFHSLAVRRDGKVIAWGLNNAGQCSGATSLSCAVSVAGGMYHSTALIRLNPLKSDTDGDSLPDGWEVNHGFEPLNNLDASQDTDSDGLTNLSEFTYKTDPRNADTDSDGMADAWELVYLLNPLNPEDALLDLDGDGVSNKREYDAGSNPYAGYFMKEIFATGIPSDWTQWAWPQVFMKWQSMKSWDYFNTPVKPASISGQMLYAVRSKPGKVRITSPVVNLGRDMSNVILKFLCWRGPHAPGSIASLNIYTISRLQQPDGSVSDQEKVLSKIDLKTGPTAWTSISLHLPDGCATRQLIFEYENSVDYSMNVPLALGVCVGEISLVGDEGRVAYQPVQPIFETAFNLPVASRELPYSCQLAVRGGVPPFQWRYQWTLVNGTLPQGLTLDPIAGTIKGFPVEQGKSIFSIEVKNDEGMATTNQFELTVMESVKALSETFDKQWLPGWSAAGWGPLVDVKALNGGNTNAWGRGSAAAYATLATPTMGFGGTPEKAVLRFRFRNPLYTTLNYRDHLIVSYQEGSTTQIIASTFDAMLNPNPTWQLLPETDNWKDIIVYLPAQSAGGKILFQAYTRQTINYGNDCGVSIDDVKVYAAYSDPLFLAWLAQHFPDGVSSGFYDDPDHDGLNNLQEYDKNTDPHAYDTDDDGLTDGIEVARGTDPLNTDTDGDGLEDGDEVLIYGTDPLDIDTDNDGLSDGTEILLGSDPLNSDTDGDTLNDGWELRHGYSLLVIDDPSFDSDNDGLTDGQESLAETNPYKSDSDGDGLSDAIEFLYGFNPNQFTVYVDTDKDGLPDKLEIAIGTDPKNWDTDCDCMSDGWEFYGGTNPLSAIGADGQQGDPDSDGLSNFDEYINGTSPKKADTDGDNSSDKAEVDQGSNPCDASDLGLPPPPGELVEIPFSVGDPSGSHSERWQMNIKGMGPADKRAFYFANKDFGTVGARSFKLRKGNSYEITLQHIATDPEYLLSWEKPDYDWQAQIGDMPSTPVLEGGQTQPSATRYSSLSDLNILIDNEDGLLGVTNVVFETINHTLNKKAKLYVLKAALVPDYDRDGVISEEKDYLKSVAKTPLRFWVNDNKDSGFIASGSSDLPGQSDGNATDTTVNGYSDLLDFTPVWINIKDLIELLSNEAGIYYYLSGRKVNFVFTSLMKNNTGVFLNKASEADIVLTTTVNMGSAGGTQIPASFINTIKNNPWKGVILIEGSEAGSTPLVLEVYKYSTLIMKCELPLQISPVETMYTGVNLRSGTVITPPSNPPEDNGKNVAFIHGYSVDEQAARAWNSEMFKRLYQSGSNAKFWGVTWNGNGGVLDGGVNYHGNALNAFNTGQTLASVVNNKMTGDKIVMAHSLGNMVVSSAIQDYNMNVTKYFMLNAAVPSEAYDGSLFDTNAVNVLVHDDWRAYNSKTWTSCWYELFDVIADDRGKLTWKNRFSAVTAVAYNYYSSGDEVFELFADQTPKVTDGALSSLGRYSWHKQESFKGRVISNDNFTKLLFLPTDYSGWGFNSTWTWDPSLLDPFKITYSRKYNADVANSFTSEALRATPVFNPNPSSMFNPVIPISTRNDILSKGIPALSPAAGLTSIGSEDKPVFKENINMQAFPLPNLYWRLDSGELNNRWLHSDLKNVAYLFVNPLFKDLCEKGGLK